MGENGAFMSLLKYTIFSEFNIQGKRNYVSTAAIEGHFKVKMSGRRDLVLRCQNSSLKWQGKTVNVQPASLHSCFLVFFHRGKGDHMPVLYEATFFAGASPIDCCQEATFYFSRRLHPKKGILCCRGLVPNPDNGVGLSRYHIQCLRAFWQFQQYLVSTLAITDVQSLYILSPGPELSNPMAKHSADIQMRAQIEGMASSESPLFDQRDIILESARKYA